jgi:hypothetical protein
MNDTQVDVLERGAEELIALLTEQSGLYEQLAVLSETQRGLITGNEPEQLLRLLSDRQKLLDQVEALAARMRPYQKSWPQMRPFASSADVEQVDRLLAKVNGFLSAIIEQDKADTQLLAARKSVVGQEVSAFKSTRAAGAAYVAAAYGAAPRREWTDR